MSTALPPRPSLSQSQTRVRSPLAALRKYINLYVSLEGAAVCLLYLAVWFWIAMVLDYGIFRLSALDWVQVLPWGLRAGLLTLVAAGLLAAVVTKVLLRLFREFSDAALALVLERRFPKELGDRLITAVELSNPEEAKKYGYSPELVEETIHQAAEHVERIPVKEVFNWRRLWRYGIFAAVLSLGVYLLTTVGFCAGWGFGRKPQPFAGIGHVMQVSTTLIERDVFLQNVLWPRRSMIEIIEVKPDQVSTTGKPPKVVENRLFVGKGKTVSLRLRAWEYVVADWKAPEGWRPMTWSEARTTVHLPDDWTPHNAETGITVDEVKLALEQFPVRHVDNQWTTSSDRGQNWRPLIWSDLTAQKLGGLPIPSIPGAWDANAMPTMVSSVVGQAPMGGVVVPMLPPAANLSLDEVEKHKDEKDAADVRAVFDRLERLVAVDNALAKIDERASNPGNASTLRKLIVPREVKLNTFGRTSRSWGTIPLQTMTGNEYTGSFGTIGETLDYTVQGEDYYTPNRIIEMVELPTLERLESEEQRPAGLYYRTSELPGKEVKATDLRGRKQPFQAVAISVAGETSTVEVPAGTIVTLTATASKPLESMTIQPTGRVAARILANHVGALALLAPSAPTQLQTAAYLGAAREEVVLPSDPQRLDDRTFRTTVEVNQESRFLFEFIDTDGEVGSRLVVLTPKNAGVPKVRDFKVDEVVRRSTDSKIAGEVYVITANARIPFLMGIARGDNGYGLRRVRYAYTIVPTDQLADRSQRSAQAAGVPLLFLPGGSNLLGALYAQKLTADMYRPAGEGLPVHYANLPSFERELMSHSLKDGRPEYLEMNTIEQLLKVKQVDPFRTPLREFSIKPDPWTDADTDAERPREWARAEPSKNFEARARERSALGCDFGLWDVRYEDHPLKELDPSKRQHRYQIDLWLEVEDTNVDGELNPKTKEPIPGLARSSETFTFLVVTENELLTRIADEEAARALELDSAYKPLPENLGRLNDVVARLQSTPSDVELTAITARTEALDEVLKNSHQGARGVRLAYERIVREMRNNQLRDDLTTKVFEKILLPLRDLDGVGDGSFERTRGALQALGQELNQTKQPPDVRARAASPKAIEAQRQMSLLVAKLQRVLTEMEKVSSINELIALLTALENSYSDQHAAIDRVRKDLERDLLLGDGK
jgi:hypothetical protein